MKKLMLCLALMLSLFAIPSFAEEVTVGFCPFDVTVNGQIIGSSESEYPFIIYRDITYMPMTYNMCRFTGMKTGWYEQRVGHRYGMYIGYSGEFDATNPDYPLTSGKKLEKAVIADSYDVALMETEPYINAEEEYPLLNLRNVTYVPLTWRVAHDLFGWDYSFENGGLEIDTRNAVRPIRDENNISIRMYGAMMSYYHTYYLYTFDSYAGYPETTYGGQYTFTWRTRQGEEKHFSLEKELKDLHITYFNSEHINGGITLVDAEEPPSLEGTVLTVRCTAGGENPYKYIILKIDMEKEELISAEKVI